PLVRVTHLLLGIAIVPGSAGLRALAALGVTQERLRSELEAALPSAHPQEAGRALALTPSAVASLQHAADEARDMKDVLLGVEHLLLGILREGEGGGYQLLGRLGVTLEPAREAVRRLRQTVRR